MSTILVTGATTPLGRGVVSALLRRSSGIGVLAVAREPTWPGRPDPRLTYVCADLTRERDIHELLFGPARELAATVVIHSAFHRSLREHGSRAHALNVDSTRTLLGLAERHPTLERFVYVSSAEVYRLEAGSPMWMGENHPLELAPGMPQRVRDRIEADLTVCTRMGMSRLRIAVLRLAEILEPEMGSQLHDYLSARLRLRPLGYDPMIQVLSLEDAEGAIVLAVESNAEGVFNVPGADTLPLSRAIQLFGGRAISVPGPLLGSIYSLRAWTTKGEFRYRLNGPRFHLGAVLDGSRASTELGYEPRSPMAWPALCA